MFDLTKFSLQDMSEVGDALQQLEHRHIFEQHNHPFQKK